MSQINTNSSRNPFSHSSYKEAISNSNRSFDMIYDFEDSIFNENDLAYRLLIKSTFKLHTNRKGKKSVIIYDEIEIGDNGDKKTIDDIKNYRSQITKLNNKYIKFLERLEEIENLISNEIKNGDKLKIILEFSKDVQNSKNSENEKIDGIEIKCYYKIEDHQNYGFKLEPSYVDSKILEGWNKEGISFFIDDINENL